MTDLPAREVALKIAKTSIENRASEWLFLSEDIETHMPETQNWMDAEFEVFQERVSEHLFKIARELK